MRELATAMYLAYNDPQQIDKVFAGPADPTYRAPIYWGPNAVPDEGQAA